MPRLLAALCVAAALPTAPPAARSADGSEPGTLTFVETVNLPSLKSVTSVDVSPDGRFLYTAAYNAQTVGAFARDEGTGRLAPVRTAQAPENLDGVTGARVSLDGRWAIAAAFRSASVTLFERNPRTGALTVADVARNGSVPNLDWAIDAVWAPDAKFAHVLADDGLAVVAFRVVPGTGLPGSLRHVESQIGAGRCFVDSGELTQIQTLMHGAAGAGALLGACGVTLSPDGRFVYVAAENSDAVTVFARTPLPAAP